jgi:hypothetical protein
MPDEVGPAVDPTLPNFDFLVLLMIWLVSTLSRRTALSARGAITETESDGDVLALMHEQTRRRP